MMPLSASLSCATWEKFCKSPALDHSEKVSQAPFIVLLDDDILLARATQTNANLPWFRILEYS